MTGSAVLGILPGKPAYQAAKTLTPQWGWGMGPKFGSAGACRTACLLHACEGGAKAQELASGMVVGRWMEVERSSDAVGADAWSSLRAWLGSPSRLR